MEQLGKLIMLAALAMLAVGALVWAAGHLGYRGLPGDLTFEGKGWKVHLPLATSLLLSLVLSVLLTLFARGGR